MTSTSDSDDSRIKEEQRYLEQLTASDDAKKSRIKITYLDQIAEETKKPRKDIDRDEYRLKEEQRYLNKIATSTCGEKRIDDPLFPGVLTSDQSSESDEFRLRSKGISKDDTFLTSDHSSDLSCAQSDEFRLKLVLEDKRYEEGTSFLRTKGKGPPGPSLTTSDQSSDLSHQSDEYRLKTAEESFQGRRRSARRRRRDPSKEMKKDVQFDDVEVIREYEKEDYEEDVEESAEYVRRERCFIEEETRIDVPLERVKDFMADFQEDQEYYEDDYDYGEGLNSSHSAKSESILDLHFPSELACLRQRERSDSILNIDYSDKSEKGLRALRLRTDPEYVDTSLRVDFQGIDYRDSMLDYHDELGSDNSNASKVVDDIGIGSKLGTHIPSSATLDRLNAVNPYDRSVSRFGSRSRLETIVPSMVSTPAPCRRVLSSDAVWLSSTPVHGKKYKSNDEMLKKRHVVRFE